MNAPAAIRRGSGTRSLGDVLAAMERGAPPVWRNSYYEGQIEDRVWRPIANGTKKAGRRLGGAILSAARELDRRTRRTRQEAQPGSRNGFLGQVAIDVLEALWRRFVDFKTGRLEPAITTIAEAVGHSYAATHAALKRLRSAGFLQWMRRSRKVDREGAGPQVEQISNAYALLIPPHVQKIVDAIMGRNAPPPDDDAHRRNEDKWTWRNILDAMPLADFLKASWTGNSLAGESLKRIAQLLDERESLKSGEPGS